MSKVRNSLIAGAALATLGISALGVGTTFAAEKSPDGTGPFSGLIEAIATKFNVSTTDVQAVFDEQRSQMMADRQTERAARIADELAQGVKDGTLTQTQSDLITQKRAEIVKAHEAAVQDSSLTREERKAAMESERKALEAWALENDIPVEYLHVRGGMGMMEGRSVGEARGRDHGFMGNKKGE